MAKKCFQWCVTVSMLIGAATASQAAWSTIHNDFFQIDQNGDSVHTRSGCIRNFNGTYYWYGSANNFSSQMVYSSPDLMHWTNDGVAITASGTNRLDVLYNDSTQQYVMFLKYAAFSGSNPSGGNNLGIATSSTPTGPFTLKTDSLVFGAEIGDMSVFKDSNGLAYLAFVWDSLPNANSGSITYHGIAQFTADYLHLSQKVFIWDTGWREAPCIMKANGLYYYLSSETMWTDPTSTMYYTAPAIAGPWTKKMVTMITPGSTDSWETQINKIFPIVGTQGTVYMFLGDRWIDSNSLRQGGYVMLPTTFSPKDSPVVNYYQDWDVDLAAGVWRPFALSRDLALHKTVTASSVYGTDSASKVTDSTTYMNFTSYRWQSAASDTQWIQVDLGSPMSVNRVILKWDSLYAKAFQVQVSTDNSTWSTVYSTTAGGRRSVTDQTFASTTARYVRMYATQRGNTNGYALFSFMVLNDSITTATLPRQGKSPDYSEALLTCNQNTIHYSVPSGTIVKLEVVDCRGKVMAVLVNGFKNAGDHEAVLPGRLSRGMYMIRLTVGAKKVATMQVRL